MAISTPRGLKIRFPVDYAFALLARVYPRADAFKVLKTTEGIEQLTNTLAFIAAIACFTFKLPPLQIGLIVLGATVVGFLINLFGLYFIPGLIGLSTLYSYVSGFGFMFVVLAGIGFYLTGWQGVIAFFAGRLIGGIVNSGLDLMKAKQLQRTIGYPLTASERHFLNAYRLHSSRLGVSTDVSVSDEEREEDNWAEVFEDFASKYPEVVQRFSVT